MINSHKYTLKRHIYLKSNRCRKHLTYYFSQTCIRWPLLNHSKVVILHIWWSHKTFIKQPQTKSTCSWQGFSSYSQKKVFWYKDSQFHMFLCYSWKLKMFLVTFDFEHTCIKKLYYANEVYKWIQILQSNVFQEK